MFLYQVPNVSSATVIKRPSKTCKTPYVADVQLENDEATHMAHTACLGCGGLVDAGKEIVMKEVSNTQNVCKYRVSFAKVQERGIEHIVGVDPKLAEDMVEVTSKELHFNSKRCERISKREKVPELKIRLLRCGRK